ncbi:hypothetical protein [Chitinophaga filiformis]|uniref:Lipoprotein n=1 Tax=Chitinophaga filiformis TaxID=104663 RepID=A0ABY4I8Q3_CHIFI|nr:hypothetical protein [Chitinophaga filiformis]UPK72267.1 hypothetical protein MYF79_13315 [Chitinophaga filiformis]
MKNANTPTRGIPLMCILTFLLGCGSGTGRPNSGSCSAPKYTEPAVSYSIYIENSGSMAGYLGNTSDFKTVLMNFVSDIPAYLKQEPNVFLIGGRVCPFHPEDGTSFVKSIMGLTPNALRNLCPSNGSSPLPQIIDSCTSNMERKVSILISDCIFSAKDGNPASAAAELKVFMAKKLQAEGSLSTIIIKYNANFTGTYYAEAAGGKPVKVKNINRPFYLLIFGKKLNLASILQKIDFKHYPGFEASYCLSANEPADAAYAVMTYKNRKGNFEFVKPSCMMRISEAEMSKGVFQFSFDADLRQLGYLDDYLLNTQHYMVNDGFSVVAVNKTTGQQPYNITLSTKQLHPPYFLKLLLAYDIPSWVIKTGNENDRTPSDSIQQHQTFGFKQLVTGISDAYKGASTDRAFKLPIRTIEINN